MRLLPRSLRGRVSFVFTVGAAVVLSLCLALLYVALDNQLTSALDEDLSSRSSDISAALRAGDSGVVARDPMAQLYASDGTLLAGSPSLGKGRLLSAADVGDLRRQVAETRSLSIGGEADRSKVRILPRRLGSGEVLVVGVSAEPLQAARERLVAVLLLAAPLLIGLLGLAGWLVVRAALRPVDILTREAAAISSVETDRRLRAVPGNDEIARLARTLDGMLGRLRVAFERERAFVDDASHELRTPIAVLPAEIERALVAALGETERLTRLAEDLLLLARERAGSLVIRREPVDLLDLAAGEARRLGPVLGPRIEVLGETVVVDGDPDRLRQVLTNLLHNSAAAGARTVHVRVTSDATTTALEIADDGPGFPPAVIDSAFERFVRGDNARTPNTSAAGLGLAIVRAVIAAHGGTVEARNGEPLGGAVVTARLPPD